MQQLLVQFMDIKLFLVNNSDIGPIGPILDLSYSFLMFLKNSTISKLLLLIAENI